MNTMGSMKRQLVVDFTKMNGAGNDFIVVDNRFFHFTDEELGDLARRFCPRRTGIGADGVLAFASPQDDAHHFRMRYVNADGSVATLCGNGARCLARFARMAGVEARPLLFETEAGVLRAEAPSDPEAAVRLFLPPPRDYEAARVLQAPPDDETVAYVWTGTEHVVRFEVDVETAAVERLGRAIRQDAALQPAGANVDFVEVVDRGDVSRSAVLLVRTYEKGVEAETRACGTGAMAAAVVARHQDRIDTDRADVRMPGGTLQVGLQRDEGQVVGLTLAGPVRVPFRGTIEV